jgi:hypothetical protein
MRAQRGVALSWAGEATCAHLHKVKGTLNATVAIFASNPLRIVNLWSFHGTNAASIAVQVCKPEEHQSRPQRRGTVVPVSSPHRSRRVTLEHALLPSIASGGMAIGVHAPKRAVLVHKVGGLTRRKWRPTVVRVALMARLNRVATHRIAHVCQAQPVVQKECVVGQMMAVVGSVIMLAQTMDATT